MSDPLYKISVIIPCFNHGAFLRETVDSVTNFQREDVELVIVDDGSTDKHTLKEMDFLIAQGIKVLRQPNRGLAAARNAGIAIAEGEFILPLDSDNRIRKCYLTSGMTLLQQNPTVGIVYGDAEYFGEKTGRWHVPEFNLIELTKHNFIDACALYRKTVWESIQGYDEKMPWMGVEDWDFWLRAAFTGWGFSHLNEVAFDYRVRTGSMIEGTIPHLVELEAYIFSKRQNRTALAIREQSFELQRLRHLETSSEYRLGRSIIMPLRLIKKIGIKALAP